MSPGECNNSTSPYCECTDFYGNVVPEYRIYNKASQLYSCCSKLEGYSQADPTQANWITSYINDVQTGTNCNGFLTEKNISTDSELKDQLPLLYYQGLMAGSLMDISKFTTPVVNTVEIACTSGVPHMLSYPSYDSEKTNYALVCGSTEDVKFYGTSTEVPYKLNTILDTKGNACTNSGCTTKYNPLTKNEYNVGETTYVSGGSISSKAIFEKGWFWLAILFSAVILSAFIYTLYYMSLTKYKSAVIDHLNSENEGSGHSADFRASKLDKEAYMF
jgi:hypothetical protein